MTKFDSTMPRVIRNFLHKYCDRGVMTNPNIRFTWASATKPLMVAYMTQERYDAFYEEYTNTPGGDEALTRLKIKYGYRCKPGKYLLKLMPDIGLHDAKATERFSALWQATFSPNLQFVYPFDLKLGYLGQSYAEGSGPLQNSCMRHDRCQSFLDFYTRNGIELAVLLDEANKVVTRALVWHLRDLTNACDTVLIDRIYVTLPMHLEMFYEQARKAFPPPTDGSTIWRKTRQNMEIGPFTDLHNLDPDPPYHAINFRYDLKYGHEELYEAPYMDTMKYYYSHRPAVSTTNRLEGYCPDCELESTDGQFYEQGTWSDYHDRYLSEDDAIYCEELDSMIDANYAVRTYEDRYLPEDCAVQLYTGEYANEDDNDLVRLHNGEYAVLTQNITQVGDDFFTEREVENLARDWYGDLIHPDDLSDYTCIEYGPYAGSYVHCDDEDFDRFREEATNAPEPAPEPTQEPAPEPEAQVKVVEGAPYPQVISHRIMLLDDPDDGISVFRYKVLFRVHHAPCTGTQPSGSISESVVYVTIHAISATTAGFHLSQAVLETARLYEIPRTAKSVDELKDALKEFTMKFLGMHYFRGPVRTSYTHPIEQPHMPTQTQGDTQ